MCALADALVTALNGAEGVDWAAGISRARFGDGGVQGPACA